MSARVVLLEIVEHLGENVICTMSHYLISHIRVEASGIVREAATSRQ
jgi:hypothetical protein